MRRRVAQPFHKVRHTAAITRGGALPCRAARTRSARAARTRGNSGVAQRSTLERRRVATAVLCGVRMAARAARWNCRRTRTATAQGKGRATPPARELSIVSPVTPRTS
eukprot:11215132-Lingulodinium_polyedra.AAC.1